MPTKPTPPIERFVSKVEFADSCWLWMGATSGGGYGAYWDGRHQVLAHRFAYEYFVGPIPEGLTLDHLCRAHNCVFFEHLEPVTNRENILRGIGLTAINARKTHCPYGHEYDKANTYKYNERRFCKECKREVTRRWRKRATLTS